MICWQVTQINDPGTSADIIIWSMAVWLCAYRFNVGVCVLCVFLERGVRGGLEVHYFV